VGRARIKSYRNPRWPEIARIGRERKGPLRREAEIQTDATSERISADAIVGAGFDRASRQCKEPPLQTIREGR
jgi:hypothetical protein